MEFLYIIIFLATIPLLLLTTIFITLTVKIYAGKSIKSSKYPPVAGTLFGQIFYFDRLHDQFTSFAKKHPTYRLLTYDQSEVYTINPLNIEHILKTNFDKYSKGKYNQDIITDLFGEGIFAVDGAKWRQQRKLASHEFSNRVLRDFSCKVFRTNAGKLNKIVNKLAISNQAFDIQDLLMKCTLDSIFKVGFGVDLNCQEGSSIEESEFMKAFDDSNALTFWRYMDPTWKLKRFFNVGCEASLKKNIQILNDFVHKIIKKKRQQQEMQENSNEKEDILSRFLAENKKNPEEMNDKYLRDIILSFLLAGKDSTANTLSWLFYMISKNPLVQEKILYEIKQVVKDEDNIDAFVENITDETLEKTNYLHAVISETLRLYPAVPVNGRVTEEDDTLPDGFKIKKGDGVYYISYGMGRMTSLWGDDAEDFRPERWLNNGVFQPESPFKFIAFHAGPRICLGKDFAFRQMKILLISLIRFFRFRLSDDLKKVTYRTMFTLHIDGGLHLRAAPRT